MDLSNIQTPADLQQVNSQPVEADTIVDYIMTTNIQLGHDVTLQLVAAAIELHADKLAELVEADDVNGEDVALWTIDLTRLQNAYQLLKEIVL